MVRGRFGGLTAVAAGPPPRPWPAPSADRPGPGCRRARFGDRLGLLQAVVQAQLPPVKQALEAAHDRGTVRDNLVALLDALEAFFLRTAPIAAAIQSDRELRDAFAERGRELDIGPHRALDAVQGYLATAQGFPAGLDLSALALLLVGAAHQRALQRQFGTPATVARLAGTREIVDALMAGQLGG